MTLMRRVVFNVVFAFSYLFISFFFFQAEDGIRDYKVTGVQTCALPISPIGRSQSAPSEVEHDPGEEEVRHYDKHRRDHYGPSSRAAHALGSPAHSQTLVAAHG